MMPVVAMLAVQLAPGCRTIGSTVRCELAAAAPPAPAPVRSAAEPVPPRRPPPRVRPARRPEDATPAAAEIERHTLSLTEIGDCTGARTYLLSIGQEDEARARFEACLAGR